MVVLCRYIMFMLKFLSVISSPPSIPIESAAILQSVAKRTGKAVNIQDALDIKLGKVNSATEILDR